MIDLTRTLTHVVGERKRSYQEKSEKMARPTRIRNQRELDRIFEDRAAREQGHGRRKGDTDFNFVHNDDGEVVRLTNFAGAEPQERRTFDGGSSD